MNPKTRMRIRTAVADFREMFPREYELGIKFVEYQRQNLKTDLAEIIETRGGGDWRAGVTIPEKLSIMIGMKLSEQELTLFKETKNMAWFAKEFPQFRVARK